MTQSEFNKKLDSQLRQTGNKPEFVSAANEYYTAVGRVNKLQEAIADAVADFGAEDAAELMEDEIKQLPGAIAQMEAKMNVIKAFGVI